MPIYANVSGKCCINQEVTAWAYETVWIPRFCCMKSKQNDRAGSGRE